MKLRTGVRATKAFRLLWEAMFCSKAKVWQDLHKGPPGSQADPLRTRAATSRGLKACAIQRFPTRTRITCSLPNCQLPRYCWESQMAQPCPPGAVANVQAGQGSPVPGPTAARVSGATVPHRPASRGGSQMLSKSQRAGAGGKWA